MDFFLKNLKETLEAVNSNIDKKIVTINSKRVRQFLHIPSSNRSKINFIWRNLIVLEEAGILTPNGITNPKTYKIAVKEKIDIPQFLSEIDKSRKKNKKDQKI